LRGTSVQRVTDRLRLVHLSLEEHGDKPVRTLSGGMLQKVLLALALGADISVLLLDEPTANLDPRARREFIRLLQEVPPHITVVLSSHQLADVEALAQRVLVLHAGRFVFDGRIADLQVRSGDRAVLHLVVADNDIETAHRVLASCEEVQAIDKVANRLSLSIARHDAARLIGKLDANGVRLVGMRLEGPTVEDVLEDLLAPEQTHQPTTTAPEVTRV